MWPLEIIVFLCISWLNLATYLNAQLAWSPIYADEKSQIDLWTQMPKGCPCPWDNSNLQCACCVTDGGCHCGLEAPNRCSQCGLEKHCNHMCNITITSTDLFIKSGKMFGQIKSPSLEGPNSCWYIFVPQEFQRVEVQIYRIVNTGKFNGSSCVGGHLQFMQGNEPIFSQHENQLCGTNERYAPPVVFFSDEGVSTLLFEITEKTHRSQFLAYFSFTAVNNSDGLGFQPRGGIRLQNTDCDWLYQDFACKNPGDCILASPGYPGVYPPHRQCKYHITTENENVIVKININSMLLPQECNKTDYVAVYKGTTNSGPLIKTICGNQRTKLEVSGANILIEFRSGAQYSPFEYNGFVARLQFYTREITTEEASSIITTNDKLITDVSFNESTSSPTSFTGCDIVITGNSRSGHFDTREYEWFPICRITFRGRPTDVIHISFFNFRLRSPSCKTVVQVFDGTLEIETNLLERLCSPQVKQARDPDDVDTKKLLSSKNQLVIFFQRPSEPLNTNDAEFLVGRYFFHDEQISGTVQPSGMCDVIFKGNTSPASGVIENPSSSHLYWNMEGSLLCTQKFVPVANQSVTIRIQSLEGMSKDPRCVTQCGDNGCRCVSSSPLTKIDHILIVNEETWKVACLCGFQQEWLPVSVRSWGPLTFVYSVAHYTWKTKGFGLTATYNFSSDTICGQQVYTVHSGEIILKNVTPLEHLNHFYNQGCVWTLHSNVERQLELDISSVQNRPCTAWNISIHEYLGSVNYRHLGEVLHTFCSRDTHKVYLLPWKVSTVIVRLRTLSRTLPQFKIKWKSQVVRSNTRFSSPTPASNAVSLTNSLKPSQSCLIICLFLFLYASSDILLFLIVRTKYRKLNEISVNS